MKQVRSDIADIGAQFQTLADRFPLIPRELGESIARLIGCIDAVAARVEAIDGGRTEATDGGQVPELGAGPSIEVGDDAPGGMLAQTFGEG